MKISERYALTIPSSALDFYDVELDSDNYEFIDPYYLENSIDKFSTDCKRYIDLFFQDFMIQLDKKAYDVAKGLFEHLHEVNNTRLGMSSGRPCGRGIGSIHAEDIFNAILNSELFTSGVANHFEDIRLFIKYIDKDKMSDMVTNIIKEKLALYTSEQCAFYGIPIEDTEIEVWSLDDTNWVKKHFMLPKDDNEKYILFVPKSILKKESRYTFREFLYKAILPEIQRKYIADNNPIVKHTTLKNGSIKDTVSLQEVYKDLLRTTKVNKDFAVAYTKEHPEILDGFKKKISELEGK